MTTPQPEAVIFCGVQATGKSSFYHHHFAETHRHISLDVLKTQKRQKVALQECFAAQNSFVLDNTNPTREVRAPFIEAARQHGFRIIGYYFRSSLDESITRNSLRDEKVRVPLVGILATHKILQLPDYTEGFDQLFYVSMNQHFEYSIKEWCDEL